jgi:hypothetical protein
MISAVARAEIKPIWNSSSFLVYTGGFTVLGGGFGALGYLASQYHGRGQQAGWALLIWAALMAIAYAFRRKDRPVASGIFAASGVLAWIVLVVLMFRWWGWTDSAAFGDWGRWSWARMALWVLILFAAGDARRRFRFPWIRLISAVAFWAFVVDLLTSGQGNFIEALSLILGLFYLLVGNVSDKPSAFWLHIVAGLLIGVPILIWCHTTTFDFAVVSFMALVYVMWAYWTRRSSWAVYGTIGFFIATVHYLVGSPTGMASNALSGQVPQISVWSYPLGFGLLGFWLVGLGLLGKRKKGHKHAAVVVETAGEPPAE